MLQSLRKQSLTFSFSWTLLLLIHMSLGAQIFGVLQGQYLGKPLPPDSNGPRQFQTRCRRFTVLKNVCGKPRETSRHDPNTINTCCYTIKIGSYRFYRMQRCHGKLFSPQFWVDCNMTPTVSRAQRRESCHQPTGVDGESCNVKGL